MDLTQLFKANVKTVRLRNKSTTLPDKTRILKTKTRDEFSIKANDVRFQITQLRDLLIENRSAYMRLGFHLKSLNQMTDEERNIIDEESGKIINLCTQYLKDLEGECHKNGTHSKKQVIQHKLGILDILSNYLKNVFQIHSEQKKCRIKHELDTLQLLKLESNEISISAKHLQSNKRKVETLLSRNPTDTEKVTSQKHCLKSSQIEEDQLSDIAFGGDDKFNSDDIQMLESENVQLINNLKGLSEEVEQIEKNVFGIAKLQEIFTEKVNVQKYDIERIGNAVVGATENIRDANEQIKQAMQRNAGLRVWVLFFLIVMSFTLLFLDWYND